MPFWLSNTLGAVLWSVVVMAFVGLNAAILIWLERKIAARLQRRVGPEVVGGPAGILQSLADGLKLFGKEDVMPAAADRPVWALAPSVVFLSAVLVFVVIPFGPGLVIQDLNIGLVFISAALGLNVIGVFMAGWGSNNKYSLLGAMRAIGMMVSYEIPLVLSVIGVALLAGSLSLVDVVEAQADGWFIIPQIIGFIVFLIASTAELNRVPFDLSIGEHELVAGFLTEYSGIRWAMFMFAEYTSMFLSAAVATTLFLGGWHGPLLPGWAWFLIKSYLIVFVLIWVRWDLPRVRIDQLMDLGWKFLIPVSLLNMLVTAVFLI